MKFCGTPGLNSATDALRGQTLWITRPAEQAEDWEAACRAVGARPFNLPCVEIAPLDEPQLWAHTQRILKDADLLVLTSPTAVRLLARAREGLTLSPLLQVAVVGPGTAHLARATGLKVTLVPERADGAGLAKALQRALPLAGRLVLVPQGDQASPELIRRLRQSGATVEAPVLYHNRPPSDLADQIQRALVEHPPAWILLASGSAFRHLLAAWPATETTPWPRLASIGPRTSEVLHACGHPPAAEATVPTIDSLLAAMAAANP